MAYFSNSSEGDCFDCSPCKYAEEPCPIALVQIMYNYDAVNNEVATNILNELIKQDGTCTFFEMAKGDLFVDKNQTDLFNSDPT